MGTNSITVDLANNTAADNADATDLSDTTATPVLEVVYHDEYCIAVNKPSGMLVHRSWLDKHETVFVMQTLRDQIGQHVYPVHRLDRPTSGVLLFALDSDTARTLSLQFESHQVAKIYWAVVRGVAAEYDRIDYSLKPRLDKIADKFADKDKPAEPAITDYQCLATTEAPWQSCSRYTTSRYSWLELRPKTGRKHQLRRHMKHIFHPILGDTTYGDRAQNRAFKANLGTTRLMLHARSLTLSHPVTGKFITITADVDGQWQTVFDRFGWG